MKNLTKSIITSIFLLATNINLVLSQVIRPGCPEKCGDVQIPYPFGIGKDCALNQNFQINCNYSLTPPKPFLRGNSLQLIDISLDGTLRKYAYVASDCYNQAGKNHINNKAQSVLDEFYYSTTRNKFIAVGCDTEARLSGSSDRERYASGCISICYSQSSVVNGSCSGIGCCQTSIPKQLNMFNVTLSSFEKHRLVWEFNPCSYAFIVEEQMFNFTTVGLISMPDQVPAVLDWAIGNRSCADVKIGSDSGYVCKEHSVCRDSDNGPGYRCFCKEGYMGNAYVHGGCVDVNECKDPKLNDCLHGCRNVEGNYTCSCPKWFHGDGRRNGQGCSLDKSNIIRLIIGVGVSFIALLILSLLIHSYLRKRKQRRLRENFFKQNGGFMLQDLLIKRQTSINSIKIFKSKDLAKATDNFSDNRICGRGGFGTVYKGCLSDGSVVAIKKSRIVDESQTEQFINEIAVLSQINHRNVVRFVGCCLDTPVPLLVYEFITNGTLSDHLYGDSKDALPWRTRLKIAAETAGVLAYLHSAHSTPIIHRDIKPTNILLDDDFTSKVSDFGASRLIPKNEDEMCTMVQGTLGYLDPEYFRTSQLTEKSDVYSFGVVLIELLTGLKAVSFDRQEEDWNLVNYFVSLMKEDRLIEILDKAITNEENVKEMIEVASMAKMCVMVKGDERPTMKEVAMVLEGILMELKHKRSSIGSHSEQTQFGEVSNHGSERIPNKDQDTSNYSCKVDDEFMALQISGGR